MELKVIGINKSQGIERLLCQDASNGKYTIPVGYTNMGRDLESDSTAQAISNDIAYEGLLELYSIIEEIMC